jgi:hypothetical protein
MKIKKTSLQLVSLLFILFIYLFSCSKIEKNEKPLVSKISNPLNLESNEKVIKTYFGEIINKEEINRIDLVANQEKTPFFYDLVLLINGTRYALGNEMKGYHPSLKLADFDNDGVSDLLVTIGSGNTDQTVFFDIFRFQKRELTSMKPKSFSTSIIPLKLTWFSDKILLVQSKPYKINIKKVMNTQKKFKNLPEIGMSGYQIFDPKDIDNDGQYEILTEQAIWLEYPHQTVFMFRSILKFMKDQWNLLEYQLIPVNLDQ